MLFVCYIYDINTKRGDKMVKSISDLSLVQDAYIINDTQYYAEGEDVEGCLYSITWDITNHDTENEDEACDWDNYQIKKIN